MADRAKPSIPVHHRPVELDVSCYINLSWHPRVYTYSFPLFCPRYPSRTTFHRPSQVPSTRGLLLSEHLGRTLFNTSRTPRSKLLLSSAVVDILPALCWPAPPRSLPNTTTRATRPPMAAMEITAAVVVGIIGVLVSLPSAILAITKFIERRRRRTASGECQQHAELGCCPRL